MTRHLITGGAGFIGSALAHRLVSDGHRVTVLDRFSRGQSCRLPPEARIIAGDIRDHAVVQCAVGDADVIWHLAYVQGTQTFYADPKDVIDVALTGMMNVLHACEQDPGKTLLLVSSSEVYQNPPEGMYPTDETVPLSVPDVTNPRYSYGGGKIACELATLAYSQAGVFDRAVIVRPHNVYGPDMGWEHVIPEFAERMITLIRAGAHEFKIQGSGRETRSFCFIDDCVEGLIAAFERGEDRGVYHLGNPNEEYAIGDLAYEVAAWFDHDIMISPGKLPEGSPTRRLPDIGKLAALGFVPRVSLQDGLLPTLAWYWQAMEARAAA
jgi:dTDP-glucose 4,6-dehydratase/UDP-glucose 4-epimerase